ncbi:hypothetical protein GS444_24275 [Rhodococcus hoagii]|nr:hypothetical protein [Prescottella equi]
MAFEPYCIANRAGNRIGGCSPSGSVAWYRAPPQRNRLRGSFGEDAKTVVVHRLQTEVGGEVEEVLVEQCLKVAVGAVRSTFLPVRPLRILAVEQHDRLPAVERAP